MTTLHLMRRGRAFVGFVSGSMLAAALMITSLAFVAPAAHAHASSDAYLHLERDASNATTLRVDIALRDLDRELAVDADDDHALTWGEVRRAWPSIVDHVQPSIALHTRDGHTCTLEPRGTPELAQRDGGAFVVLRHDVRCADSAMPASVTYRLFESTDAGHRGLLRIDDASGATGATSSFAVLKATADRATLHTNADAGDKRSNAQDAQAPAGGFMHFAREGLAHIASGADHVLFLVLLIAVCVFARVDGHWVVRTSTRAIVGDAVRIVTAFTLTHSITLGLAAAGAVAPSSRWVESVIASSVLVAAIDNLRPVTSLPRWALAGIFGFAHGFGFAGPLQELGLRGAELVTPLLAFNLGVEAGQLVVVALLLPLLLVWRHAPRYRRTVMPAMSIAIGVLAGVWLVERGFDLDFGLPL